MVDEHELLTVDVKKQVEWIEKELSSMQGLLEDLQQHRYNNQEQALNDWEEKLNTIARDAKDLIETFGMKTVNMRRWGFLYWRDKYKIRKEVLQIRKRLIDISQTGINLNTNDVSIPVETPGEDASSSAISGVVVTAIQKLDHILSQTQVTGDEVIEMVEQVKGELSYLQNIGYNLKLINERENLWLKEVKKVCNDTECIAQNFIVTKERWSKIDKLQKLLFHGNNYASEDEFKRKMAYIRTQIGDAFRRNLTYEVGEQLDKHTTPITTPLPELSPESLLRSVLFSNVFISMELLVKLWWYVDKNLESVQRDLDLMLAFLRDTTAESEQGLNLNERQRVWLCQLQLVAQNAHSLADAYAKAGFLWSFIRRFQYAKGINYMSKEILSISQKKNIYGVANILRTQQELARATSSSPSIQEDLVEPRPVPATASYLHLTRLKGKVQSMREELELMDALAWDVQNMGGELDRRSRNWVDQMKGIATEARSIISEYDTKLKHKSLIPMIFDKNLTWHFLNDKIDNIRKKIDDTWRRRKTYDLVHIQSRAVSSATVQILHGRRQPHVFVAAEKESCVLGFDEDAQVLIAQLLSGEKRHCITWIVGIGGTGKTTLAKMIWEDKAVVDHFDCQIWVSVPSTSNSNSNYTAQQLLEEIAKESAKQIKGTLSSDPVLETLAHKRYLIVVDGIEETNYELYLLDTVKEAIPDMLTSSRLLLTTRNTNVAQHTAGTITFVHPLQLLDDESSWLLFRRHLKMDNIPGELVTVGKKFVAKCGGLPSQILKMSDLLSHEEDTTRTREEWLSVFNQIQDQIQSWSEAPINTDLPSYLRRCLSYFILFPDEFEILVRRLVILWVAENLVHHSEEDDVPPELVAERYLTELIDQNMVQVAARKRNGKIKTCRLPNALRQLWLTDSGSLQGRRTTTDMNADPRNSIIRRVADHLNSEDIWHDHIHGNTTSLKSSSLRTYYKDVLSFMSFNPQEGSKPGHQIGNFLEGCISSDCFLLLRVLDLERVYKPKLPKRIARLTRLRYLGLRWTYLESLPSSISNLFKLQTLDLKHTYIHTLPTSIWKMELRHLFLSETYRTRFPPQPKDNSLLSGLFVDEETSVQGGLDNLVNIKILGLACQSM